MKRIKQSLLARSISLSHHQPLTKILLSFLSEYLGVLRFSYHQRFPILNMQYTLFALATAGLFTAAQCAEASPIGSVIPIGQNCTPGGTPCAIGANCYAVNSMLQPVCGNFQASCQNDQQCAFNTCNGGFCNGFLASSSSAASSAPASPVITSTPTGQGPMPAPSSTVSAAPGSLPLGAECNPFVKPSQCVNGVQCWASNAMLIARCGNFNAECETDAQCAYNTCSGGLCRGFRASSSGAAVGTMAPMPSASSGPAGNATLHPTGGATPTTTGTVQFTGAASAQKVVGGVFAFVFGAVALGM